MNRINRKRMAKALNDIAVFGDGSTAQSITDAFSLASKGVGEVLTNQATASTLKKAKDDAAKAQSDALIAQAAAVSESDPTGPNHQAAAAAAAKAQMAAQRVIQLQTGAGGAAPATLAPTGAGAHKSESPWYLWPMIFGGVAVGGALIFRTMRNRPAALPARGSR